MTDFKLKISNSAQKSLDKLNANIAAPIIEAILFLAKNPRPNGYIKLKGRDAYRVRTGNYRIIYEIKDNELLVLVVDIGHRKDIYR